MYVINNHILYRPNSDSKNLSRIIKKDKSFGTPLTLTLLRTTKYYSIKSRNQSKSDYVIDGIFM